MMARISSLQQGQDCLVSCSTGPSFLHRELCALGFKSHRWKMGWLLSPGCQWPPLALVNSNELCCTSCSNQLKHFVSNFTAAFHFPTPFSFVSCLSVSFLLCFFNYIYDGSLVLLNRHVWFWSTQLIHVLSESQNSSSDTFAVWSWEVGLTYVLKFGRFNAFWLCLCGSYSSKVIGSDCPVHQKKKMVIRGVATCQDGQ